MDWPTTLEELIQVQAAIDQMKPEPWLPQDAQISAAGAFVCFPRNVPGPGRAGDPAWAAAALLVGHELNEVATLVGASAAPFIRGALALREGPLLEAALRSLRARPDLVFVDATGRDHPRGAGLALQLGAVLDRPTIGVTRRPLVAKTPELSDPSRGARAPLEVRGQIVGYWLRTQAGAEPIAVHAAWRTEAELAAELTLAFTESSRTPEPIRQARRAARQLRASAGIRTRQSQ